jgi:hypothetical protein
VPPSTKPAPSEHGFVPHPDDVADLVAAYDEAERGELLSAEDGAAHLRALLADDTDAK